MGSFNKVYIIGNLTRDIELRYTPGGKAVCDMGVAVNEVRGTGDERAEETTFIDVTVWDKQAEVLAKYVKKGSPLHVWGRLKMDTWESKEGEKRSKLKVVLEGFTFIGTKDEGQQKPSGTINYAPGPSPAQHQAQHTETSYPPQNSELPF